MAYKYHNVLLDKLQPLSRFSTVVIMIPLDLSWYSIIKAISITRNTVNSELVISFISY